MLVYLRSLCWSWTADKASHSFLPFCCCCRGGYVECFWFRRACVGRAWSRRLHSRTETQTCRHAVTARVGIESSLGMHARIFVHFRSGVATKASTYRIIHSLLSKNRPHLCCASGVCAGAPLYLDMFLAFVLGTGLLLKAAQIVLVPDTAFLPCRISSLTTRVLHGESPELSSPLVT